MAFIYDVDITVHSVIEYMEGGMPSGEPEVSITTHQGFMKRGEGVTEILYNENTEGGKVHTEIKLLELPREICTACADSAPIRYRVELTKHGAIESRMELEEGKSFSAPYSIPPYRFDMELKCGRIRPSLSAEGGELRLTYDMTVGGACRRARLNLKLKRV